MNLEVVINDLLIDVVGDDQAAMFLQDACDCQQLVSGIAGAGGVTGAVENEDFCSRRQRGLELFGCDPKTGCFAGLNEFWECPPPRAPCPNSSPSRGPE